MPHQKHNSNHEFTANQMELLICHRAIYELMFKCIKHLKYAVRGKWSTINLHNECLKIGSGHKILNITTSDIQSLNYAAY